jgi:hypothetical protein
MNGIKRYVQSLTFVFEMCSLSEPMGFSFGADLDMTAITDWKGTLGEPPGRPLMAASSAFGVLCAPLADSSPNGSHLAPRLSQ